MKKSNVLAWILAVSAALSILFFFVGSTYPFRILAWIPVLGLLTLLIGVLAALKGEKVPLPVVLKSIITILVIACGFLFTRKVYDAILLGCCLECIVGLLIFQIGKAVRLADMKTEMDPKSSKDTKKENIPLESIRGEYDTSISNALGIETFTIGKEFPWKQYVYPGDHIVPDINMGGFDVIASLTDLTNQEKYTFGKSEIKVSIFEYSGVPFVIMNYDDIVRLQFSINIQKMKAEARQVWVADKENSLVKVFLLESNDGTLQGIRSFDLKTMPILKGILSKQLSEDKEEIDGKIRYGECLFDVKQMEVMAQYTEVIPRPEIEL